MSLAARFLCVSALSVALSLALIGCGKTPAASSPHAPAPKPAPASARAGAGKPGVTAPAQAGHGDVSPLGSVSIGGYELALSGHGQIAAGHDSAVSARVLKAPAGADWREANLYLWVEDKAGKRLNAPAKALVENGALHLHASIPTAAGTPDRLVFRLRSGASDLRAEVKLSADGGLAGAGAAAATAAMKPAAAPAAAAPVAAPPTPGHTHDATAHDGVVARLGATGQAVDGWIELKLHDDKGDLELWLTLDKAGSKPLDLPLDTKVSVRFVDKSNKTVLLKPRDTKSNPDERGASHLRDGKTNYFVFPGTTGADATWLMGEAFSSIAVVELTQGGRTVTAQEFVLRPHGHGHDHGHDHGAHGN